MEWNLYHSSVTKTRTEVILQGTNSLDPSSPSAVWEEYEFKCKPGNVTRIPCLISPYHYRLDWLMWFAAFQVLWKHWSTAKPAVLSALLLILSASRLPVPDFAQLVLALFPSSALLHGMTFPFILEKKKNTLRTHSSPTSKHFFVQTNRPTMFSPLALLFSDIVTLCS